MVTGYQGTFVISWAQSEVDGLSGATLSMIDVGSTWRWTGRAVRVDDPRDILVLERPDDIVETHRRAANQVRRFLGDPNLTFGQPDSPDFEGPLFESGFDVTDGKNRFRATLIELEDSRNPMVLFIGAMPPVDQDLWVVSHEIEKVNVHGSEQVGGMICFIPGTRLATPDGPVAVEELGEGDKICTKDNGAQEIRWVGSRHISGGRLVAMPHLRPVRLKKDFLSVGEPDADLFVSPDHRVLIKGPAAQALFNTTEVLVTARDLINDTTVRVDHTLRSVSYVHIMLDQHQIVWANGVECESFHPANASLAQVAPQQRGALVDRFPTVQDDPFAYGDFARRNLTQAEAAILSYGALGGH